MSKQTGIRFRVGTLLFVTFVAALCGSLIQQAAILGSVASIPIAIALVRTLRQNQSCSLLLSFGQSLGLLIGLFVFTLSAILVSGFACAVLLLQFSIDLIGKTAAMIGDRLVQYRWMSIPAFLGRALSLLLTFMLQIIQGLSVNMAIWLSDTNRSMATLWRQQTARS